MKLDQGLKLLVKQFPMDNSSYESMSWKYRSIHHRKIGFVGTVLVVTWISPDKFFPDQTKILILENVKQWSISQRHKGSDLLLIVGSIRVHECKHLMWRLFFLFFFVRKRGGGWCLVGIYFRTIHRLSYRVLRLMVKGYMTICRWRSIFFLLGGGSSLWCLVGIYSESPHFIIQYWN